MLRNFDPSRLIMHTEVIMRYIPCTMETGTSQGEDFWIIRVPADAVETAASLLSELLSGTRKRIVFLDRKTEFILTADTAAHNGRSVPITKDFLEYLDKLFSVRRTNHIDYDFSDCHGDVTITVFVT